MDAAEKRWLAIDLVFLLIYFLIFFILFGVEHTLPVWINIFFILLSHFVLWFCLIIFPAANNRFVLSSTLLMLCIAFILIVSLIGTVLMIVASNNLKFTVLAQLVLLLLFVITLLGNYNASKHTADQGVDITYDFVNRMIYLLLNIQSVSKNRDIVLSAKKNLDLLRSSQYQSKSIVLAFEQQMIQLLTDVSNDAMDEAAKIETLDEVQSLLSLRSELLKA